MQLVDIHTDALILHHAVDRQLTDQYALHCHTFYEVFYFIAGEVSYLVEGRRYVPEPHSLLLIAPNVFHGVKIESDIPYERISLHFVPDFLAAEHRAVLLSPFHAARETAGIYYTSEGHGGMFAFFEQLMDARLADPSVRTLSLRVRLEALLSQILMRSLSRKGASGDAAASRTITRLLDYLNAHIAEPITLDELSAKFYVSKHHLNKMFKRATGTTVGHYVIHKRVVMAQNLMLQGQSAGAAAAAVGFRDYSAFYRAFKSITGHAPSDPHAPILLRG
ncbi:AraC family transcriptional regulator [Cohnella nanjingensis]|uniref:Helix-turn-helix domain-containing protein n=1 Tax=Cohnella nanjingensis TaxID=1387779 RepID=A0A7X0RQH9_9BACL|nr:AraC family transcriptional regulator [Cohnella nanjingensis]MBB6671834.1 helix-turn-helix domain-containing protein [Cohnella nanjingensis]